MTIREKESERRVRERHRDIKERKERGLGGKKGKDINIQMRIYFIFMFKIENHLFKSVVY